MDWLHRFLVPSEKNGYRPTSLESTAVGVMLLLIMCTFALANVQSILLVSSDWLVSTILPAALIDLTNENREEDSLPDLKRSTLLDEAATLKAKDMAAKSYFSHDSPDGVTPWYWFKEVGYSYAYAGENLAVHFSDSEDVVKAWMNSPGHRANILGNDYQEIGIGTAKGTYKGSPTVFVVQLFGTPLSSMIELPDEDEVVVETPSQRVRASRPDVLAVTDRSLPPPPQRAPVETAPQEDPKVNAPPNEKAPSEALFVQSTDTPLATPLAEATTSPIVLEAKPYTDSSEVAEVIPRSGQLIYSSMAATTSASVASLMKGPTPRADTGHPISSFFTHLLSSPHTFISFSYLILTFIVATMLSFSVVVEWRRQHPVQVAYAVGLAAIMLITFKLHLALTAGAVIL